MLNILAVSSSYISTPLKRSEKEKEVKENKG
jgi:hypothetical protein